MPIVKAADKLIFYAHVPKCGGSSVEVYLQERFGQIAFFDKRHTERPRDERWSRTSPQHIAMNEMTRLFPEAFFDHSFTIVRHPVARVVSAFHFQVEIQRAIPETTSFSEWLTDLPDLLETEPFAFDNHIRPMVDLVPDTAKVFHLEHGIDALVMWLDEVTGQKAMPRAIPWINEQAGRKTRKVKPTESDVAMMARIYAADFERFGYSPETTAPKAPAPVLTPEVEAAREAERTRTSHPIHALGERLRRVLKK